MASKTSTRRTLTSAECRRFWREAFHTGASLLPAHNGKRLSVPGAAHYAADFADRALTEYGQRFGVRL